MQRHNQKPAWRWPINLIGLIGLWLALPAITAAHSADEYLQATYIVLSPNRVALEINLTPGLLVASEVIALIDADHDGQISEAEGQAYANAALKEMTLRLNGRAYPLVLTRSQFPPMLNLSSGAGTIRLDVSADVSEGASGNQRLFFQNRHQPVKSLYQVNAFSQTAGQIQITQQSRDELQQAVQVDYAVMSNALVISNATGVGSRNSIADQQQLVDFLYAPLLSPWLLGVALGLSALLGGLHALTPGHGKTLLAAYLIGSRGTIRHAFALGGIVTFTHTASVIGFGLLTLLVSQFIMPSTLLPVLEISSGLLVVMMGVRLMWTRWGSMHSDEQATHDHVHHQHTDHTHQYSHENVKASELWAMGISGGLVPCPEALGILLVAIGLNRMVLGLGLIVAFSLGLATMLIMLGVLLVHSRTFVDRLGGLGSVWQRLLPLVSAIIVTLLGAGIALKGLMAYASHGAM